MTLVEKIALSVASGVICALVVAEASVALGAKHIWPGAILAFVSVSATFLLYLGGK